MVECDRRYGGRGKFGRPPARQGVVAPLTAFKDNGHGGESGFQAISDETRPKTVWVNTSPEPIANPFIML